MKVIKHGTFYKEDRKIECICGCEYEYEMDDIYTDSTLAYITNPQQYKKYVKCPECGARTDLGTSYSYNPPLMTQLS